jgi:hypothetical protein
MGARSVPGIFSMAAQQPIDRDDQSQRIQELAQATVFDATHPFGGNAETRRGIMKVAHQAQAKTFRVDLTVFVAFFLLDFALLLYTASRLWTHGDAVQAKSVLFLLPTLLPGGFLSSSEYVD